MYDRKDRPESGWNNSISLLPGGSLRESSWVMHFMVLSTKGTGTEFFLMDDTDQISHAECLCRVAGEDQHFIPGRATPINNRPGRSRNKVTSRRRSGSLRSKTIAARSFSSRLCRALGESRLTQRTSRVVSAFRLGTIPAMLRELPYTATRLRFSIFTSWEILMCHNQEKIEDRPILQKSPMDENVRGYSPREKSTVSRLE